MASDVCYFYSPIGCWDVLLLQSTKLDFPTSLLLVSFVQVVRCVVVVEPAVAAVMITAMPAT